MDRYRSTSPFRRARAGAVRPRRGNGAAGRACEPANPKRSEWRGRPPNTDGPRSTTGRQERTAGLDACFAYQAGAGCVAGPCVASRIGAAEPANGTRWHRLARDAGPPLTDLLRFSARHAACSTIRMVSFCSFKGATARNHGATALFEATQLPSSAGLWRESAARRWSWLGWLAWLACCVACSSGEEPSSTGPGDGGERPETGRGEGEGGPSTLPGDGEIAGAGAARDEEPSDAAPRDAVGLEASGLPAATDTADGSTSGGDDGVASGEGGFEPGSLTAGVWDDNRNFDHFLSYRAERREGPDADTVDGWIDFSEAEHREAQERFVDLSPHTMLDVALVVDTTGSMGDELSYLQSEFDALSSQIEAAFPNAEQRWSLVVYRDTEDEYVARWFDFREDLGEFRQHLSQQQPNGGGDYPEASHVALAAMNQLSWRSDAETARLAFWLADAPHHLSQASAMRSAILEAQAQDVHLYPVASSGVDEMTELSMRSAAQLTGGRYLFLTDDSGYGGPHLEPSLPCYFVTRLDHAILRMVQIELSGAYSEPAPAQIVRTGGDPQDGACLLESGQTVVAF